MLRIILSLFTIAMILVSFSHEGHEVMTELQVKVEKVQTGQDLQATNHCDGHDNNPDHCHIHCTGLHFLTTIAQSYELKKPISVNNQIALTGESFFKSPFLDPAIKPPSYS